MENNFGAEIQAIMSKLTKNINDLKANGDNKNGQIETKNEKNQLCNLLAGTEAEIENYTNTKAKQIDNTRLTRQEADSLKENLYYARDIALENIKKFWNNVKASLMAYQEIRDNHIINKKDVTQTYEDGSFNIKIESYEGKGYLVKRMTNTGSDTGEFRVYKNNKDLYADKDYVANLMGLKPITENFVNKLFGTKPEDTNVYIKEKHGKTETYYWDNNGKQFIKEEKTDKIKDQCVCYDEFLGPVPTIELTYEFFIDNFINNCKRKDISYSDIYEFENIIRANIKNEDDFNNLPKDIRNMLQSDNHTALFEIVNYFNQIDNQKKNIEQGNHKYNVRTD